ncbi:MAG: threonylcarbamoyl-AMP synthase [Acidimicrobiales bacterium]|nr:threonylcarbamoyl-AMP synthase [Acidimicrobiales bacterium]
MPEVVQLSDHSRAVDLASEVLEGGGTVLLPTDTLYGVAALPGLPGATARLFELKDRAAGQPLAVLLADDDQLRALVEPDALTPQVLGWVARFWPGPLTLVMPRAERARSLDLGGAAGTIGVRCPDHRFARDLARRVGPIATTSANRHGEATPRTAIEAAASLAGRVDLVVDGGPAGTVASTVVDVTVDPWRLLRVGAVTDAMLGG